MQLADIRRAVAAYWLAKMMTEKLSQVGAVTVLQYLHWLLIRERVEYRLAVTAFKTQATLQQAYLQSLQQLHVYNTVTRTLD